MKLRIPIAIAAACLVLAPLASAGAPLAYATPAAIAAKITGTVPQIQLGNAHVPSVITGSVCRGLGAAHQGKFNTFSCKATWENGQKTSIVWVRARAGGQFCASTTGLDACPVAAPTGGDPRVCSNAPAPPTADPNRCASGSAISVLVRSMKVNFGGASPINLSCTGKNLAWVCVFSTSANYTVYHSKITFTQNAKGGWTASIVESGSSCTVVPGPAQAGSRWVNGPLAVCTH